MIEPKEHPAKFSEPILKELEAMVYDRLPLGARILDPFAGVGGVHVLHPNYETFGVEIEEEWAVAHPRTQVGDSTQLTALFPTDHFDAVVTSPGYANRMSDNYGGDPKGSKRYTYRIFLGRLLKENNGAKYNWSSRRQIAKYKQIHEDVWKECFKILSPGGYLLLNVSNHIRKHEVVDVVSWHQDTLTDIGFEFQSPHSNPNQAHEARSEC